MEQSASTSETLVLQRLSLHIIYLASCYIRSGSLFLFLVSNLEIARQIQLFLMVSSYNSSTNTLSCRLYQLLLEMVRSREARGMWTSPRNWFLPNLSQSHTLNQRVREFNSDLESLYCVNNKIINHDYNIICALLSTFHCRLGPVSSS